MDKAGAREVLQYIDMTVEQLEHEIVDALQAAACGGIGGIARKFFKLVVDPADDAVDPTRDGRVRAANQQRRNEFLVEHDGLVAELDDTGNAEIDEARLG